MADARDPDFYLTHQGYVRALARRLVYDPHAADDLFQAAWLAALQRPARDGSSPRRWLAGIVRNLASKAWLRAERRRAREERWEPPAPASSPDAVLAHEQERRRVVEALLALDEPYRATLIARFFDGLEPQQIAARDGVPVETVRTRQKRGLERLRERLLRGGGSVPTLVHGLQLGAPGARLVLGRVLRGAMLMHTKKILASSGILLVATIGWLVIPPLLRDDAKAAPPVAAAPAEVARSTPASGEAAAETMPTAYRQALPSGGASAPATGSLQVRVRWADLRPAADIGVRVGSAAAPNHEAHAVIGRTDDAGRVRFEGILPGEAWVECDRGAQLSCTIRAGATADATLTIERGARIHGRVLDVDGRPAVGAQVYLLCRHEPYAGHVVARADENGSFAIADAPAERSLSLSAFAPHREPTPQHVMTARVGDDVAVELRFATRGGAIGGRVTDERGAPVAGALVLVGPELGIDHVRAKAAGLGSVPPLRVRRTSTDEHGEWLVDGFVAGDTPVLVMKPLLAPWTGTALVVEGRTAHCDVVLAPGARLQGTVREERGAQVAGATVRVSRGLVQTWLVKSDAQGSYALDGLPLGPFPVVAAKDGAGEARTTQTGVAGSALRWDPLLSRACTLRGRVLASGTPVSKARIDARCMPSAQRPWFADATTDAEGRFEITNCPDALLHLDVRMTSSHFTLSKRDDVDPRAGEVVLEVDPARVPSAFVVGRVLDPDGKEVAGADVSVLTDDYEWGGGHALRSGADGRFRSPAVPAGTWYLTVNVDGFAQISAPRRTVASTATLEFGDLVLTRGSTLVVTLQPDAGIALDDCVVGIADAVTGLASRRPEHGVARFERLAPGEYTITAYAPGTALRPVAVHVGTAPETALALRLSAGSEVTVDVRDALGEPMNDRLETELFDGKGTRIDFTPLMPGNGPLQWIRRLVPDRYELRLRDHRQRTVVVPLTVPADGKPVQATARFP